MISQYQGPKAGDMFIYSKQKKGAQHDKGRKGESEYSKTCVQRG